MKKIGLILMLLSCNFAHAENGNVIPKDEAAFIGVVNTAIKASDEASNDMQKGGVKSDRDEAICKILKSKKVNNWVGTVDDVNSNGDGKGVLSIKVSDNITIKTWNNAVSDIADNTLIPPKTAVFKSASMMTSGDVVVFSGTFAKDSESCIRESSLSLDGGLSDPEFIFRFSSVNKS